MNRSKTATVLTNMSDLLNAFACPRAAQRDGADDDEHEIVPFLRVPRRSGWTRAEALGRIRAWLQGLFALGQSDLLLNVFGGRVSIGQLAAATGMNKAQVWRLVQGAVQRVRRAALAEVLAAGLGDAPACAVDPGDGRPLPLTARGPFAVPLPRLTRSLPAASPDAILRTLDALRRPLERKRRRRVCVAARRAGPHGAFASVMLAYAAEDRFAAHSLARTVRADRLLDLRRGEEIVLASQPAALAA